MSEDSWQLPEAMQPPSTMTAELFLEWRGARTGTGNPERMTNPVWVWLARQPEITAYQAMRHFGGGMARPAGWTNQRFGQTITVLPDGRTLAISRQEATRSDDGSSITVRGGQCEIERGEHRFQRDAVDDHVLDLTTLIWTRLTDRRWQQFELSRSDGRMGDLWDVSQLADYVERPDDEFFMQQAAQYRQRLGREPDLGAWRSRFRPPVPHETLPRTDDDWRVHRIRVDGAIVRYVDSHRGARVVIEGAVRASVVSALIDDLRMKLSRADASPYVTVSLDDP